LEYYGWRWHNYSYVGRCIFLHLHWYQDNPNVQNPLNSLLMFYIAVLHSTL